MDEESKKKLQNLTVEQLRNSYTSGNITAGRYNELLHAKAKITLETANLVDPTDYVKVMWTQSVKHFQDGWDNVVEAATRDTAKDTPVLSDLYYSGLAAWGMFSMLMSPLTAWGEVNGEVAKRLALGAGASPGAAHYVGLGVDLMSGFVPAGKIAQSGAKGIQGLSKAGWLGKSMKDLTQAGAMKQVELIFQGLPFKPLADSLQAEGVKLSSAVEAALQVTPKAPTKLSASQGANQFANDVANYAKDITIDEAKKQLPGLAEKMGINLDDLKNVVPGGRFDPKNAWYANPKKMYGYLQALEARGAEIGPLAKAALEGDDNTKLQFARYMSNLFSANPDEKIRYGKEFMDMMMHWDPENMAKGDIGAAVATFAKDMAHMADTGGGFGKMIFNNQSGSFQPLTLWRQAREVYLNTLLPFSWKAAFLGNTYATGGLVLERAIGAMFPTGTGGYTTKGALYLSKGLMLAMGDGTRAFADAYRHIPPGLGRFSHAGHQIPGEIGQILNIPMDTIRGMDNFFAEIITRASHYAVAAREGEQVFGFKGTALGNFIRQRVANPTADMLREARELAETSTFQNQLGPYMQRIQRALQWGPGVLFFPFMKSGINLGKYVWDRTPGLQLLSGQLYRDIAGGGAKADAAVARIVMGQMMGHMYFELAKDGYITGGGPVDPQVKRAWDMTHQRYSVASESGWVPLANMEPANTMPGMIADVVEVVDSLDPLTAEQAVAAIGFSFIRNFTQGTWWPNASALQDVVQTVGSGTDFTNAGYKLLRSPISAPFQGLSPIARGTDPILRQTRSYIDDVVNKIPWKSKELPPVRDGIGDPVVPPIVFGGSWFGLMRPIVPAFRPYEDDPVKKELARLGVKIPLMTDHLGGKLHEGFNITAPRPDDKFGIRLTPDELDLRMEIYRRMLRHPEYGIEQMMNDEVYTDKNTTDSLRRADLERFLQQTWQHSGDALMIQRKDIAKRVLESDVRHIMALTPDQEKEGTQQDLNVAIEDYMKAAPEEQENLMKFGIIGSRQPAELTYGKAYGPLIHANPGGLASEGQQVNEVKP